MNKKLVENFLAKHLQIANSKPPDLVRNDFYKLKKLILSEYGTKCKETDLQHIVKYCYNCEGDGCSRCGNPDGIWDEFYSVLEIWRIGSKKFHNPIARTHNPDKHVGQNVIRGYIVHKEYPLSDKLHSFLILCILFDRKLFFKYLPKLRFVKIKIHKHPLLLISKILSIPRVIISKVGHVWFKIKYSFTQLIQSRCSHSGVYLEDEFDFKQCPKCKSWVGDEVPF